MRQYQIVCRGDQWQLLIEGQECGLLQCEERAFLVQIACRVAAERGTAVHVFDDRNELEARLTFQNGSLAVDGCYRGDLDVAAIASDVDNDGGAEPRAF